VALAGVEDQGLGAELLADEVEGLGHRFGAEGFYLHA
jgi:hypothetical protein